MFTYSRVNRCVPIADSSQFGWYSIIRCPVGFTEYGIVTAQNLDSQEIGLDFYLCQCPVVSREEGKPEVLNEIAGEFRT